jgi:hypothetical protein
LNAPNKERNIVHVKAIISHIAVRKLGIKKLDIAASLSYSSTAVTQPAIKRRDASGCGERPWKDVGGHHKTLNIKNVPVF